MGDATTPNTADVRELPIDAIVPSASNPRRSCDLAADEELLESVRLHGIITPLLVTPIRMHDIDEGPDLYELVAGHRRFAAARELGLETVPVILRDGLSDHQRRELAIVENLHRQDLAPLDEAEGFRALLDFSGSGETPASLSKRVGKTERHVWDTLKLLDLVTDAQRLLADGILPLAHAQLLAKLTPADQARAIKPDQYSRTSPVFDQDDGFDFDAADSSKGLKHDKWEGLKPVSVGELRRWINDHVRFNPAHAAQAAPLDFGETAAKVQEAVAQPGRGKKVVSITFDNFVQPDAKDAEGERTYSARSWRRADGQEKSKVCDASVLGVVVVGPRYGETFDVCVKKGCPVHWPEEKTPKAGKSGPGATKHAGNDESIYRRQQQERQREEKAWATVYPQVMAAIVKATSGIVTTNKDLVAALDLNDRTRPAVMNAVGSITYKTFGRALAIVSALSDVSPGYYNEYTVPKALKAAKAKFDIKAAMKAAVAQLEKPATEKAEKAAPKKPTPAMPELHAGSVKANAMHQRAKAKKTTPAKGRKKV